MKVKIAPFFVIFWSKFLLTLSSPVSYPPAPHTLLSAHRNTLGAWHVSPSPVFGQLSCDTPSVSALDCHQRSSARLGSAAQSRVSALCWVLSYIGSVQSRSRNTCGGKWPSRFSGPAAHAWQFTMFLVQTASESVSQYHIDKKQWSHSPTESNWEQTLNTQLSASVFIVVTWSGSRCCLNPSKIIIRL